jgi:hypothetical protein
MSSSKLHPIYVALENHNFTKAIKLCLAQPPSNTLAQALLAHAYARSGQRYKALLTLESILGSEGFPELRLEIKYSLELRLEQQQPQDASAHPPTTPAGSAASKKGGKKGKKKVQAATAAPTASTPTATANDLKDWDLIDQLDTPPVLPDGWEQLPPSDKALTDQTLLSTLASTLLNHLKLPLSNYQLYCWAASTNTDDEEAANKAYLAGFPVLVAPQYESLTLSILAHMQVLALQLSRIQQQVYGVAPAAAWAAQTALWQIQYKGTALDEKQEQRLAMLPRLAESLASKCVQQQGLTTQEGLVSPEDFLLHLRTLDQQSKWEEMLTALNERLPELQGDERMSPPRQIMIDSKLDVLEKLKRYTDARVLLETELLKEYPDNWTYWKKHLDCCLGEAESNHDGGLAGTEELLAKTLSDSNMLERQYPLRGPRLMKVELATVRMQRCKADESNERVATLIDCIIEYSDEFATRASCTFSDLALYVELALDKGSVADARSLVDRLSKFRVAPTSDDSKQRSRELRAYIFAVKMIYKIVSKFVDLADQLPDWKELLKVWRDFQSFETKSQEQKESRPGDDLILLAIQQLLLGSPGDAELGFAAAVLESAIQYSPDNAYLKISAMFLYSRLDAVSRSWDLFQELFIKHIQYESCAYLILPLLRAGGFYSETISVCQEIIRLQTTNVRDAGEFTGRAMDNGTMSKADEFLAFQRSSLNNSLTTLEAKGLILDCAPMYVQDGKQGALGAVHGIVGGESDLDRANKMVAHSHSPFATFSLLRLKGTTAENLEQFTDNRDFTILSHDLLTPRVFDSREQIISDSIRRGHHHNLLIRAALCVDATKGPKKGKVLAVSSELKKRSSSLLSSVVASLEYCDTSIQPLGYEALLRAMLELCGVVTGISAGMFPKEQSLPDTLETREEQASSSLKRALDLITQARQQLNLTEDQRVSRVGVLLPDYLVPIFALFQMCAKMMEAFGWGKRKRKTRRCAAALADLALALAPLVEDMQTCVAR